jgi:superfamily I DNA and/or RNA helicase
LVHLSQEKTRLEAELSKFHTTVGRYTQGILDKSPLVGCTLAKMVLEKKLHDRSFDAVVVDEASMVSLAYAVAASMLAKEILVDAGDPHQLPPICDLDSSDARYWFGQNVYDWLHVEKQDSDCARTDAVSLLKRQYRMTSQIGSFVSALTYEDDLEHARAEDGQQVEFIELPEEWCRTYYSVSDTSYYHAGAIALIHEILPSLGSNQEEVLLLSPFRSQQALMRATLFGAVSVNS